MLRWFYCALIVFQSSKVIFILYLNIILVITISHSDKCTEFTDCYNCTGYNHIQNNAEGEKPYCTWKNGICEIGSIDPNLEFWWEPSNALCKANNKDLISQYCGDTEKGSDDKSVQFSINKVNGKYGEKNMVCAYYYKNFEEKNQLELTATVKLDVVNTYGGLYLHVFFTDGNSITKQISKEVYKVIINQCTYLYVYYGMKEASNDLPFIVEISIKKKGMNISLIISIIFLGVAVIACGIIIFICSKKIARRRERALEERFEEREVNQRIQEEEELKKRKMNEINKLLKEDLKPVEYKEKLEKLDNNCTICLDEFVKGDSISITKCNHVFHYKCIKKWLTGNKSELKCPNCNSPFIHPSEKQKIKNETNELNSETQRIHLNPNNITSNMSSMPIYPHRIEANNINVLRNNNT